jgi:platelet-activating factor acetylhydrolase IB subunit alpha
MASLTLTDRQRNDLNNSILEYLMQFPEKFSESITHFRREAEIQGEIEIGKGLLEKKWTAVIRLQKRIQDLEAKITQLQQSRSLGDSGDTNAEKDGSAPGDSSRLLPRPPAKYMLEGHRSPVTVVATHPVFTLCASGSEDNTIRLWDHETGAYERTLKGHTGYVTGLAFDPRGTLLASCSLDMSAKLWDMTTFSCTKTLRGHEHTISCIRFSISGDHILTCSRDATIKMWDVGTGYCTRTFAGHGDWVKSISVSLDGNHIASASSDHTVIVWQVTTGNVVQTLRGHEHVVESVAFGKRPLEVAAASSSTAVASSTESSVSITLIIASTRLFYFCYI